MTTTAKINWPAVQERLYRRQHELWDVRNGLAGDMRVALHITPMIAVTPAVEAIEAAISAIEELRNAFREAEHAQ